MCEKFNGNSTQENFETAFELLDNILNLNYLYICLSEYNRANLI